MNTYIYRRGFTLIELLVVIAIIGILASVVLASLNSARSKGSDAAVKSSLDNMRAQAELFYSNYSHYGLGTRLVSTATACDTTYSANSGNTNYELQGDQTFYNGITGATTAGGSYCAVINTASMYAVAVVLNSDTTQAWCIDANGSSKLVTTGSATAYTQTSLNADISSAGCGT